MEYLPQNPIIQFDADALEVIRKRYGYDSVERIRDAVDILDVWVKQQNHFVVKDFPRRYLEATIIICKGSIERAKTRIDKLCTFKTLLPQYFGDFDVQNDFKNILDVGDFAFLPKQAPDCRRVIMIKLTNNRFSSNTCLIVFRLAIMIAEYFIVNECSDRLIFICDYREADIMDIIKNTSIMDLRNGMSILVDGFGARIHGMHIFTESKAVEMLINILKQVMSKKIIERVFVHKNIEEMYKLVPKSVLPAEYGGSGTTKSVRELRDNLLNELSTKEATESRKYMNTACTDEELRQTDVFNDQCLGMPGSFRSLTVD